MNSYLAKFAWHIIKKFKFYVIATTVLSLAWTVDSILWPKFIEQVISFVDTHTGKEPNFWQLMMPTIIFGFILWNTIEFMFRVGGFVAAKFIPKLQAYVREYAFSYVLGHSHNYYINNFAGSINNKINDMVESFTSIYSDVVTLAIPVVLTVIFACLSFYYLSPYLMLFTFAWIIIFFALIAFFIHKINDLSEIHAERRSELIGQMVDCLSNALSMRLFARKKYEISYFKKSQEIEKQTHIKAGMFLEMIKLIQSISYFFFAFGGLFIGSVYFWKQGVLTTGELVFVFSVTMNVMQSIWFLNQELPKIVKQVGVFNQAMKLLSKPHEIKDEESSIAHFKVKKGAIEFKNVNFRYLKDYDLFNHLNVTIKAGMKVGLVGFSGSGKTSFVNLILRLFDIDSGKILIDNIDIKTVPQDELREQISYIPQDPVLFHRSILENIAYGLLNSDVESITKEEMTKKAMDAAEKANATEFIEKLAEKYDTFVGERGVKLSGGQRQRIAIARAILRNAPILILDEATSALDSATEKIIHESLMNVMSGKTTIVIAHRLSTLSQMDRILVFDNGKIIEDGTHEELIKSAGHYKKLWDLQVGGFLPEHDEEYIS